MNPFTVPTHFSGSEARLAHQLLEVLIDTLIDFHAAFCAHYRLWLEEPPETPWLDGTDDDDIPC